MSDTIRKYNRIAKYYDFIDSYYEKKLYSKMREKYISPIINANILEVGIGTGKNLDYYHHSNKVMAIDTSEGMIRQAYKKLENNFNNENIAKISIKKVESDWGLEPLSYQYVVATFVIYTNKKQLTLIDQIYEALDYGGKVIIFEWIGTHTGIRAKILKLTYPFLNYFFGVSIYRKASINNFKKNKWELLKKEYFNEENVVFVLQKKAINLENQV